MNTTKELSLYCDKRDNTIVKLILLSERFVRVKPAKGLDIVLSLKSFEENYRKITK
jgi:hypothetical protein